MCKINFSKKTRFLARNDCLFVLRLLPNLFFKEHQSVLNTICEDLCQSPWVFHLSAPFWAEIGTHLIGLILYCDRYSTAQHEIFFVERTKFFYRSMLWLKPMPDQSWTSVFWGIECELFSEFTFCLFLWSCPILWKNFQISLKEKLSLKFYFQDKLILSFFLLWGLIIEWQTFLFLSY